MILIQPLHFHYDGKNKEHMIKKRTILTEQSTTGLQRMRKIFL